MDMERISLNPAGSPGRFGLQLVRLTWSQARKLGKSLAKLYLPVFLGLVALVLLSRLLEVPLQNLTRDPLAVVRAPFYTGILSNLGILLWCATAAICLFSAVLLGPLGGAGEKRLFLLWSGAFTTVLLLDDLFLLHEVVFPYYLNLRERYVILLYGFCMVVFLLRFWRLILQTDFLIFLCACGFFTLSLGVDKLPEDILPLHHIFEDGSKFIGIVSWLFYLGRMSFLFLLEAVPATAMREDS
ncbi:MULTISPECIES: hypothetical protein [Microbulbifer]|uniref:hypothetical protein n=1 Tax=Microbulbifer TaxID=48073 RepID=UPI001E3367F0|nr:MULTISPECIES: hypothetical protein [Microbulbifer]UHQ54915.1 hypothetical protein LVE68_15620 [Microbulbifer sp. YPW16]